MPKIGDGYFQFSSRGLKDLLDSINLVGGSAKKLENIGIKKGLFENSLSEDLAAVRLLTAEIKTATKQAKSSRDAVRQLRAESARSSLNTDRLVEQRRATANSRANIARNDARNVASSPAAMAAEAAALETRRKSLTKTKKTIKSEALIDPTTTAAFKNAVDQTFQNLKGLPATQDTADKIRDAAKALGRFRTGNVRQVVDEMNALADATEKAAKAADRLARLEKISASLSPEKKQQIRGSIRDELNAPERAAATSRRQAQREVDSEPGGQRIGRRIDEIGARDDLTDSQRAAEVSIASDEVVESLERLAQRVREVPIDTELQNVAEKFRQGTASEGEFRAAVTASKAKKSGVEQAANITGEAEFRARNSGDSESTVELTAKLKELAKTRGDLIKKNSTLSASEQEVNEAVIASIRSDIKSTAAKRDISRALDAEIDNTKALLAEKSRLDVIEAKSGKLVDNDAKAREKNNKELDAAAKRQNKLKSALKSSNASLHDAAGASRNLNFKYQQLSYGVQDFVQVIGQTGLSGALRASANNMASFFGASGTGTGAVIGGLGTIAMIGLAEALTMAGDEAETAEDKFSRLSDQVERFADIRERASKFSGEIAGVSSSSSLDLNAFTSRSSALTENTLEQQKVKDKAKANADISISELSGSDKIGFFGNAVENIGRAISLAVTNTIGDGFDVQKIAELRTNARGGGMSDADSKAKALRTLEFQRDMALQENADKVARAVAQGSGADVFNEIKKEERKINQRYAEIKAAIVDVDAATAEGAISIAAALDESTEELKKAKEELKALQTKRAAIIKESEEALSLALDQISEFLETQVRTIGRGDLSSLDTATSSLTGQLRESESREAKNRARKDDILLSPEERTEAERRIQQEEKLQGKLVDSLKELTKAVSSAPVMGRDGLRTLAEESRIRVGRASTGTFDQATSQLRDLSSQREDARIRHSQQAAIVNDPNSTASEAWEATIEAARLASTVAELDKAMNDLLTVSRGLQLTFGKTDRLITSQTSRDAAANRFGSFQTSQQQMDPFLSQIEESKTRLRDAQRTLRSSVDPTDRLSASETVARELKLQAELTKSVQQLTVAANGIPSSLSGISGSISSEIMRNSSRRLRNEEAVGNDPAFNQQNTQASIETIGDAVLQFSGQVQRKLGETQEEANRRESERLQKMIDALQNDTDAENDALIPFLKMAQRKIGVREDGQEKSSVTAIEELHQRIQESLRDDTSDFDLQVKQADLLQQIANNTNPGTGIGGSIAHPPGSGFMSVPPDQVPPGANPVSPDQSPSNQEAARESIRAKLAEDRAALDKRKEDLDARRERAISKRNEAKRFYDLSNEAYEEYEDKREDVVIGSVRLRNSPGSSSDGLLRKAAERDDARKRFESLSDRYNRLSGESESEIERVNTDMKIFNKDTSSFNDRMDAFNNDPMSMSPPLSSNVQTDTTQQTQTAQTEAIQYQKRAADTLVEMLKLMKTRGPSEGLLIG